MSLKADSIQPKDLQMARIAPVLLVCLTAAGAHGLSIRPDESDCRSLVSMRKLEEDSAPRAASG